MKKYIILLLGFSFLFQSCFEDADDNTIQLNEIKDFVWKSMNGVYLYKSDVADLADNRFKNNGEYVDFLDSFSSPENLFKGILFDRANVDRFSFITSDFVKLEQLLAGTSLNNGLRFRYAFKPGSSTEVYLVISLVLKGSNAESKGLNRGMFIDQIDGKSITEDNVNELLSPNSYSLHFADYNNNGTPEDTSDDELISNGNVVEISKSELTQDPIHKTEVLVQGSTRIGYLMYNRFSANFNSQLNQAFGQLASENVTELVLDLRYNPGGSVSTAALLGSLITGQFSGQVYSKLFFNENLAEVNNTDYFFINSLGGNPINNLNLSRVIVLTTGNSASASELVINSLKPYIEVVQIGGYTEGKTQASITVYDSPTLTSKENRNPNHDYAMQPLVANSTNVDNELVPFEGIKPLFETFEVAHNMGTLGDPAEPFLAKALEYIATGDVSTSISKSANSFSKAISPKKESKVDLGLVIDSAHMPIF